METTISNFKKAIVRNDTELTYAVLENLASVVRSYALAARDEHYNLNTSSKYGKTNRKAKQQAQTKGKK